MKKSDATPGTKVLASIHYEDEYGGGEHIGPYKYDEYGDNELVGVIRSKEAKAGHVWVKWIEGDLGEEEQEVEIKILMPESDRNDLEQDFKKISKEVKEKMKAAASLVREAGKLAKSAHTTLESMYDATSPLISAMDSNGWRSSSWGC